MVWSVIAGLAQIAKMPRLESQSKYIGLAMCVPPTSCLVESFFSQCSYVLTDHRQSLSPVTFEEIMYLKANADWWDRTIVAEAMQGPIADDQ